MTTMRCSADTILYQRISGGWEFQYTSHCETYRGFDYDPVVARARLLRQLGWDRWRLDRVQYKSF